MMPILSDNHYQVLSCLSLHRCRFWFDLHVKFKLFDTRFLQQILTIFFGASLWMYLFKIFPLIHITYQSSTVLFLSHRRTISNLFHLNHYFCGFYSSLVLPLASLRRLFSSPLNHCSIEEAPKIFISLFKSALL